MSNTTISRDVARKAANWLVLLHSDDSTPAQESACLAWRKENPEHENAWLKAQALQQKLGILPPLLAMNTLNRVERYDRRKAIKSLVVLITSVPVAYATYKTLPWYGLNAQYQTSMGEQQHIMLEDGTEVFLNTDTRLDVNYTAQQRTLELYSGEILIQTGSDTNNRPFFVKTRQGLLRPIGTRFLVRELNKQQVHLSVLQGAVEVQPTHARNQSFSAGQQTYFSEQKIALAQTNQAQNDAWVRGVLYADNMPLAQFVNELSRYRRGILRCDPAVAMLGISGTFQLNNIDNILTALPDTLPVSVDFLLGYWVTVKAKNSA